MFNHAKALHNYHFSLEKKQPEHSINSRSSESEGVNKLSLKSGKC